METTTTNPDERLALPEPHSLGRWFSVNETADRFDISPKTVRKLIARGVLRAVQFGSVYRISERDLDEYVQRGGLAMSPPPSSNSLSYSTRSRLNSSSTLGRAGFVKRSSPAGPDAGPECGATSKRLRRHTLVCEASDERRRAPPRPPADRGAVSLSTP